jgi:hypothetical protein
MTIRENNSLDTTVPPFEVLDENGNVVFYATTKNECQEYIDKK